MRKIIAYTHVGDYGEAVDNIHFLTDNEINAGEISLSIEGNYRDLSGRALSEGILSADVSGDGVNVVLDPFLYRYDFKITGKIGAEEVEVTKDNIDEVIIKDVDSFRAIEENGVHYRLYEPEAFGPRPLVLFLHGGGECGEYNRIQSGRRCMLWRLRLLPAP